MDTPILAAAASPSDAQTTALAAPFLTTSTALPSHPPLSLRIAPELWLKRLMLAGSFDRIFEIGPSFRNEGLDATHNPEFLTCEFYRAHTPLEKLISMTEGLLSGLAAELAHPLQKEERPYQQLPFVPTLEAQMRRRLPRPLTVSSLTALCADLRFPTGPRPTIAGMLDKLQSTFIEPLCALEGGRPTWITEHPAAMSPFALQIPLEPGREGDIAVAARAELFVRGVEVVNCYEEQNDPVAQRRAMMGGQAPGLEPQQQQQQQQQQQGQGEAQQEAESPKSADSQFCDALEWGLPPTGGWGCGIDRLVMLLTDARRISHVRAFGGLQHVVTKSGGGGGSS